MSLEQAILDRLEKRNAQIAQLQSTVHALERAADSQREHAILERGRLLEENKKLAAQIESDEKVSQSNQEHAQYQIASLTAEVARLRAEVPLESTREALKNAVAKLQEVNAQLDSAKGEAEEWMKQCHAARRQRDEVKAEARKETQRLSDLCAELQGKHESLLAAQNAVKADVAMVYQIADKLGRNQAESIPEFMERQALRLAALESKAGPSIEALSAELSVRYAEIAELHKWATGLIESPAFAHYHYERVQEYNAIVARINSRPQLDLTATLPTVDWQVVARNLEQTIAGLNAKVAELEAQAGKIGYVAKGEHEEAVRAARENGIHKGESLSGFIWRQCEGLRKSQAENAPLNKLFAVLCKQRGNLNEEIIYRAVDEASNAIKRLTA